MAAVTLDESEHSAFARGTSQCQQLKSATHDTGAVPEWASDSCLITMAANMFYHPDFVFEFLWVLRYPLPALEHEFGQSGAMSRSPTKHRSVRRLGTSFRRVGFSQVIVLVQISLSPVHGKNVQGERGSEKKKERPE